MSFFRQILTDQQLAAAIAALPFLAIASVALAIETMKIIEAANEQPRRREAVVRVEIDRQEFRGR